MNKKLLSVALSAVMILGLTSCGKNANNSANTVGNNTASVEQEEKIFNNYGREVVIEGEPEKVLTLGPNCTELFCALGLQDKVIGNSLNNHSRGPLEEYKESYEAIPEINHSSATREAVETSGADFIYGIDWEFGDEGLNIDELQQFGITTYMNSAGTIEEEYQEIKDLGEIFNIEERANEFIEDQEARIAVVEERYKDQEPLKVLVYDSGNNGVFTCGGNNFESILIEKAGGENIFKDQTKKAWITVSYEEVIDRNPDLILIHDYDSPSVEEKIKEIKANPVLSELECVKNDKFAVITLESVLPGGRMAHTIESLAEKFHE